MDKNNFINPEQGKSYLSTEHEKGRTKSKVLAISSSLRFKSNSDSLVDEFIRGAAEAGHDVEKISLRGKNIQFCQGCLACQKTGSCVIKDDMPEIMQKMHDADVIVFATPIYYYEMCGQMKTLLDRANPLYDSDYHFRNIYMLTAAAEDEENVPQRAISGLEGWIECFPKAHLEGTVFAGGVTDMGDIAGHKALMKAYELGKTI
ncbi:MAG: flavodoxin family protein [Prevotella sp.]